MNVTKPTVDALYDVIGQCFQYNRWIDRLVSVMGVKFACNNTSALLHEHVAHFFPVFADEIGETCLERYNISIEYQATDAGKQDYNSVTEMIVQLSDKLVHFQNILIGACKIAFDNNDLHVYADLLELLSDYNIIVEQAILLKDKIENYGEENIMAFDAHIRDNFWILGGE